MRLSAQVVSRHRLFKAACILVRGLTSQASPTAAGLWTTDHQACLPWGSGFLRPGAALVGVALVLVTNIVPALPGKGQKADEGRSVC